MQSSGLLWCAKLVAVILQNAFWTLFKICAYGHDSSPEIGPRPVEILMDKDGGPGFFLRTFGKKYASFHLLTTPSSIFCH